MLDLPNLKTLEIGQGCLNGVKDDLVISNLPNLEKIVMHKGSLIHLNSLTISNNEKLRDIEVGGSFEWGGAFEYVKKVTFESIVGFHFIILYLPNLKDIQFGGYSFTHAKSLTLRSNYYFRKCNIYTFQSSNH